MKKHYGIATLGGLILAVAVALPSLSHAMQLGLDLDSNVNVDLKNDREADDRGRSGMDVRATATSEAQVNTDDKQDDNSNDERKDRDESDKTNRSGFFGRIWAMFNGNVDKNGKEAEDSSDVVVTASTTVDADVSVDGPKIYWLRSSTVRSDSATILWISTERTTSRVWIEKDSEIDTDVVPTNSDDSFSYFHKLKLEDLEANTTYHFKVASTDKDGNTTISTVSSFTTKVE